MPQVIIPKPLYPTQLNEQNLTQAQFENQNINSLVPKESLSYSKKLNGAFKLYKQKRNRNKDRQNTENKQTEQIASPVEKKVYRLKNRKLPNQLIDDLVSFKSQAESVLDYFDPNTAPTFVEQENKQFYLKMYKQKLNQSIEKKSIQNQQRILVQKKIFKQNEQVQSQNQFVMIRQEGKASDPFIILKKTKIKRTKNMKYSENLPTDGKKNNQKKDDYASCKPNKMGTLQKQPIIQQSFKKQKKQKKQELQNNECSLKKEQRTECKQRMPDEKGISRKRMRDQEDNFSEPRFILHLTLESQSNNPISDFQSLVEKQALPLIK